MATKGKSAAQGKEKSSLSHSSPRSINENPQGRRTPKPSNASSPEKDSSVLSDKSIPNYLKPTKSSASDAKHGKKETPEQNKTLLTRRSFDRPLSSLSQVLKTSSPRTVKSVSSPSTKTVSSPRLISGNSSPSTKAVNSPRLISDNHCPSPKTVNSPRLISDKTSKTQQKNVKSQPILAKQRSMKKSPKTNPEKETKSSTSRTPTTSTPSSPDFTKETEGKQEEQVKEHLQEEMNKIEGEKEIPIEVPEAQDRKTTEVLASESKNTEEKLEQSSYSTLLEELERALDAQEQPREKRDKQNDDDNRPEEGHGNKGEDNEELNEHPEEILASKNVQEEAENKEGEVGIVTENPSSCKGKEDPSNEEEPDKMTLQLQEGRELSEKEVVDGESQGIELKERPEVEGTDKKKQENENVALKRQNTEAKKEAMAYNDVIEETASKLVGKRKNKVLALVGAFETVISLQEPEGQQNP
ncbi:PREDICTED: serine/arginine repetitive matrix protein 1-like [Nelumbo nucifera]|uniref:Calmodulin-binding domain-containing protein n=2 Tax=Nelumbo nucifera TaxID=4432 RepID=A0A822ZLP5_NELNU|nr:PREDICTED: serine/arginine repetitive matrix protein 1-like [Nelumbo nucifera]DAD45673.1 TPA_asm: hypothetical protein HUJ06_003903 [Nelumbo nucifera]